MKAEVVQMTAELAERLLEKNSGNRDVNENKIREYTEAMNSGDWLENGESIIVDVNQDLKDGQHRLISMIKTNKFYKTVLVTEVEAKVMQTIDIGKGRNLADILKMEKVKYASLVASVIPKVLLYTEGGIGGKQGVTNSQGLNFYYKQPRPLGTLAKTAERIYSRQVEKVLPQSEIALFHYVLSGYELTKELNDFLNAICGVTVKENKAASYLYRKFLTAKQNRIRFLLKYKIGMVIKAWNIYNDGDPDIKYFKYDSSLPLPEIDRTLKFEKIQ